jgi:hypothetical protein
MALPQTRPLTDDRGWRWTVTVDAGRLVLTPPEGEPLVFANPAELRSLAPQLTRAVAEHTLDAQEAAVRESLARRRARAARGEPTGLRGRPFVEPPEPAMHLDPLIVGPRQEAPA